MQKIYGIVVTHSWSNVIFDFFRTLDRVPGERFELYLLLNGVEVSTAEVSAKLPSSLKFNLFTSLEKLSTTESRNLLLQKLQPTLGNDDWILFLDDDVELPEDYAQNLLESIETATRNGCVAIAGANLTDPNSPLFERVTGEILASPWIIGPIANRYRKTKAYLVASDLHVILCHFALHASGLRVPLFDSRLTGGEELLLTQQILGTHAKIWRSGTLNLYHRRRASFNEFARQMFKYGCGRGQVIQIQWGNLSIAALIVMEALVLTAAGQNYQPLVAFYLIYVAIAGANIGKRESSFWLRGAITAIIAIPMVHIFYVLGLNKGLLTTVFESRFEKRASLK